MNPYKKLFSNTAVLGIATVISKVMVFFLMPLFTAVLTPEDYSISDTIVQCCNLIIPIACVGISNGIFRFAADHAEDKTAVLTSGVLVQLFATGTFLILSPLFHFAAPLTGYGWLVVVYVVSANYQALFAQFVRAMDHTKLFAAQGIINTALTIAFNLILLLVFKMGIQGYVLATVLANCVTTIFLFFAGKLWREIDFSKISGKLIKRMVRYSVPMIFSAIFWMITDVSDRLFVSYMVGQDVNGLYAAASRIPTILVLLVSAFNEAWQLSAIMESEDEASCLRMFSNVNRGYIAVCFMGCSGLILFCRWITSLLYDSSFYLSWQYMPLLLLATVFANFDTFLGSVYQLKKKPMWSFITAFIGAAANLPMNYFFIREWGAMGAALATILSYFIVWVLRAINVRKIMPFKIGIPAVALNTVLITGQIILILTGVTGKWDWFVQVGFFLLIFGLNFVPFFKLLAPKVKSLGQKHLMARVVDKKKH